MPDNQITVQNNNTAAINLEITDNNKTIDINFLETINLHNTNSTSHENIVSDLESKIALKANSIDMVTKVDTVSGKGLSTNDLTDSLKSNYDTAYTNNHTHNNKTILDSLISNGNGISYLANDGTYKIANSIVAIGTCSTAAATAEKAVTLPGFTLTKGATIQVIFSNANTANAPTLNVNGLGAKSIASENGTVTSSTNPFYVPAGVTVEFTYNGTYWVYKNRITANYLSSDGMGWYRIWTNGFKEQGQLTATNLQTITFLINFSNTNYVFFGNIITTTPNGTPAFSHFCPYTKTTSGVDFGDTTGGSRHWIAYGY